MSNLLWQRRIRNWAGFLGGILPWISLLGAYFVNRISPFDYNFWKNLSISETYYITPALVGILTTASIVLMCYDGYDLQDNLITTLSGVFGLMIVLFPCKCNVSSDFVGFFQLSEDLSNKIHCASAVVFFCLLAYNSLFLFTKHDGEMSDKKKIRNIVYRVCGIGMLVIMSLMVVPINFFAKTWWVEMGTLTFFSISWLTKGCAFNFLND